MKTRTKTDSDASIPRLRGGSTHQQPERGLQSEKLCDYARRRTGLEDFGDPAVETRLQMLVNSLENEADLHPVGRFLARTHLRCLLETQLQLTDVWNKCKEIESEPIQQPIFITGMPRSGSTFLHELLAQDRDHRVPRAWEVMFPSPRFAPG